MLIFVGLGVADAAVGWADRSGDDYHDGEDDRKKTHEKTMMVWMVMVIWPQSDDRTRRRLGNSMNGSSTKLGYDIFESSLSDRS